MSAKKAARIRSPKKSPRATVKTVDHKPGAHALAGSEERRTVLMHRALALKIRGHTLLEIADTLAQEYGLVDPPPRATVYDWIEEAMADGRRGVKRETENYILLAERRSEEIIRRLIPFACGDFVVERTKLMDGESMIVIDEKVLRERVLAASEVRKQIELVAKLRGIGRAGNEEGGKIGPDGMQTFILQTVHNHIAKSGQILDSASATTVLELDSGDATIDRL